MEKLSIDSKSIKEHVLLHSRNHYDERQKGKKCIGWQETNESRMERRRQMTNTDELMNSIS